MIWDSLGESPIQFLIFEKDLSHLNGVYINSVTSDEKLQDEVNSLNYDNDGQQLKTPLNEFPIKEINSETIVIICGVIP